MNLVCQKVHDVVCGEAYRPSRNLILTSLSQVGLSWTIQKIAISIFALQGSAVIICSFTVVCLGVSFLAPYWSPAQKICRFVAQLGVIRLVHEMFLTSLIHEGGHASAGALLYRSTKRTTIEIELFGGAATNIVSSKLSSLGSLVGRQRARLIVAAAGPMASILFGVGMFAWAAYKTSEVARERMAISGAIQMGDELSRCWTAYWLKDATSLSNDYIALKELGGISPLVMFTCMALIPVMQIAWISYRYLRAPKSLPIA